MSPRLFASVSWSAALLAFSFFMQQGGWFRVSGVVPNFAALAGSLIIWFGVPRGAMYALSAIGAVCGFLFFPFWNYEIAVMAAALALAAAASPKLTGNPHADFFIRIPASILFFHGALFLLRLSPFPAWLVIGECLITLALAAAVWALALPIRARRRSVA